MQLAFQLAELRKSEAGRQDVRLGMEVLRRIGQNVGVAPQLVGRQQRVVLGLQCQIAGIRRLGGTGGRKNIPAAAQRGLARVGGGMAPKCDVGGRIVRHMAESGTAVIVVCRHSSGIVQAAGGRIQKAVIRTRGGTALLR